MAHISPLGKIAWVDLTTGTVDYEQPGQEVHRRCLGGPGLVLSYLLNRISRDTDPLGPDNVLAFSAGLLAGTQVPGFTRYAALAKSPLTGGLGRSEAGGFWGPELKKAGFSALMITGRAAEPVYLYVTAEGAEIRPAYHLWGVEPKETARIIKEETGQPRIRVACVGLAGENQLCIAGISNDLSHFNGRNGMGAVMGSKNLKAIAVRGAGDIEVHNKEGLRTLYRETSELAKTHSQARGLHQLGTSAGIEVMNAAGCLPTNNWQNAVFADADRIGGRRLNEEFLIKRGGCYMCPVRCKRVVAVPDPTYGVDSEYGGPEYETLGALGSSCGVASMEVVIKANEMCNRYTLDTISAGMTIAFAMACYEAGLLTRDDTGGLDLRFGNEEAILSLIDDMVNRRGLGALLADGSAAAAKKIGRGAEEFLLTVKNQELPMHDPRVKVGLGLQYALSPVGADHWFAQHDPLFATETSPGCVELAQMGLGSPVSPLDLGPEKVRMVAYTSYLQALYDNLGVCIFTAVARSMTGLDTLTAIVRATTGWDVSLWELLKAGERTNTLYRLFNIRQGIGAAADALPGRLFQPFTDGPLQGKQAIDQTRFVEAVHLYYAMSGWDPETGEPTVGKLSELGLQEFAE